MISWRRGKSAGWSAFDLKHRPEKYGECQRETEAFPPLSRTSVPVSKNSVNHPYISPTFVHSGENKRYKHLSQNVESGIENSMNVRDSKSFNLQSDCRFSIEKETKIFDSEYIGGGDKCEVCTSEPFEISDLCISFKEQCNFSKGMINVHASCGVSQIKCGSEVVDCVLSEPEWEENDIYMIHRKCALRTTRAASHHSKAATKAFLRGDHVSSQQLSKKAKEEWISSNILNNEAAKEILKDRNKDNGKWKLDLHGLHVAEAVHALKVRLHEIEESFLFNREHPTSLIKPLSRCNQRSTSLQVITGAGNHSRGPASLPAAVRNHLTYNCYRFDELRPGVFSICLKFR